MKAAYLVVARNRAKKLQKVAKKVLTTEFWFGILIERLRRGASMEEAKGEGIAAERKEVLDNLAKMW